MRGGGGRFPVRASEGVEGVGVDHHGFIEFVKEAAGELAGFFFTADTGAEGDQSAGGGEFQNAGQGGEGEGSGGGFGKRLGHELRALKGDLRQNRFHTGHGYEAGAGPHSAAIPDMAAAPLLPFEPATIRTWP